MKNNIHNLWLKFSLKDIIYAIDCTYVKNMISLPKNITPIANTDFCIEGVSRFNDTILTIISLRKFFNMPTFKEDISNLCEKLKHDHIRWVNELENCILNKKLFSLTDDPHECDFGKWYYNFHSSATSVRKYFKKVEEPHKRLHKLAEGINDLIQVNSNISNEKLENILNQAGSIKNTIVSIIEAAKGIFESSMKEMVISLETNLNVSAGFIVDEILGIEALDLICDKSSNDLMTNPNRNFIDGIAKDKKGKNDIILIIDSEKILNSLNVQQMNQEIN